MQGGLIILANIVCVAAIVMGVFFGIRAFYRFKKWQDGTGAELWPFLAYAMSAVGSVLLGIAGIQTFADEGYLFFYGAFPLFLILGVVATGLMTYYFFLKWREAK